MDTKLRNALNKHRLDEVAEWRMKNKLSCKNYWQPSDAVRTHKCIATWQISNTQSVCALFFLFYKNQVYKKPRLQNCQKYNNMLKNIGKPNLMKNLRKLNLKF